MSEPRTIKQLMMDMGISREKEESLKKDILASLGSPDTAPKLSPAEIQNLSLNFINSAKGAEYFARHGSEGERGHEKSREEVENSFPDLVRRIQTNKRKNLGKRPAANPGISNKLNTSANIPAIVEGTVPGRTTVNQQDASAYANDLGQTVENSDEDHNGERGNRVGDIWEIQSLPDVENLVGRRQRRPVPSETYDFSDASPEPDVPTRQAGPQHLSRIVHDVAQPPL
ncbi:hypothetical protein LTR05_001587 [Lithohypha guttulata]|uniref:Uncharacterized protein n=1 Tax=Lithohypha guttulata TaxID=1690604 RepID=A0AAN7T6P8_9EURO|nr:hypothetical protein LTR05_001587 [Lithohypha guttulata]